MFVIDKLLLSPLTGLLWLAREIERLSQQEGLGEREAVVRLLAELHFRLDSGEVTQEQFAAEEGLLLDRLDAMDERGGAGVPG